MKRLVYAADSVSSTLLVFDNAVLAAEFNEAMAGDLVAAASRTKSNNYLTVMQREPKKFLNDFKKFLEDTGFTVLDCWRSQNPSSITCYFIATRPSKGGRSQENVSLAFCIRTSDHRLDSTGIRSDVQIEWLKERAYKLTSESEIDISSVKVIQLTIDSKRNSYQQYLNRCESELISNLNNDHLL